MDYKGDKDNKDDDEDSDLDDETTNVFNALVVNIDPSTLLNKDD